MEMPAMTTTHRNAQISHTIGSRGILTLKTVRGAVRVRAVPGDEARVLARYADGPPDLDPEQDGGLRVTRGQGTLTIEADERDAGFLTSLGRMMSGTGRSSVEFDVELPALATLRLSGISADLSVEGLRGDEEVRTVSGDVRLLGVSGRISLQSVSGDVRVAGGTAELNATTTSGDLATMFERYERLRVHSVSGDVTVIGALDPGADHSLESISGDVELAPTGGLTIRISSMSGSIHSELPHQRQTVGSQQQVVIGDGAGQLTFRTMSGDMRIMRTSRVAGAWTLPEAASTSPKAPIPQDRDASLAAAAEDAAGASARGVEQALPLAPSDPASAPATDLDELSILRALERGEIDVDQAARLLEEAPSDD